MYRLYLFHPGRCLVNSFSLFDQSDIKHVSKYIAQYNEEENTQLIRAILGPTDLAVLKPDDELRIPGLIFAASTGRIR